MADTCYPSLDNNQTKQIQVLNLLFKKLEACSTEEELQTTMNDILAEKQEQGLISIDQLAANNKNIDTKNALALIAECAFKETIPEFEQFEIQPSALVSTVQTLICNPPTITIKPFELTTKPLGNIFKKILAYILEAVSQILTSLLSELLSIVTDFCETGIDSFNYANLEKLVNPILNSLNSFTGGAAAAFQKLENILNTFGLNINGDLVAYPFDEEGCTPQAQQSKPFNNFFNELPLILTPFEICSLLEGSASSYTLETVRQLIVYEYPNMAIRLTNNDLVQELFQEIGVFVDPNICSQLREIQPTLEFDRYDDLCQVNESRDRVRQQLLINRGHTEAQSLQIIKDEKKKIQDRLSTISSTLMKLRKDPKKVLEEVNNINIFCKDGKQGIATLNDIPFSKKMYTRIIENTFEPVKTACKSDLEDIPILFVEDKTVKKKIKRYVDLVVGTNENGRPSVVEGATNPLYIIEEGSTTKLYYTKDEDFALETRSGDRVTLISIDVEGAEAGEYVFDSSKLILNQDNDAGDVQDADEAIEGIIKQTKVVESIDVERIEYELVDRNLIQSSLNNKYYPLNPDNFDKQKFIKDYSVLRMPEVIIDPAFINNIDLSILNSFIDEPISQDDFDQALRSAKTIVYSSSSYTSGPYQNVEKEIDNYISPFSSSFPYIENVSPQEIIFRRFAIEKEINENSYTNIYHTFLKAFSKNMYNAVRTKEYQNKFINDLSLIPFTKMVGIVKERNKVLKNFLNDPCSLSLDTSSNELSPINKTIVSTAINLLARNHVYKNNIKFLYYMPFLKMEMLIDTDDLYLEFLTQTFKQDMQKLFANSYDTFILYLEQNFDTLKDSIVLRDPLTNDMLLDQEYSTDFKIKFILKTQFVELSRNMKVINNLAPDQYLEFSLFSKLFYQGEEEFSGIDSEPELKFYTKIGSTMYSDTTPITANAGLWGYGIAVYVYDEALSTRKLLTTYEQTSNVSINNTIFNFTDQIKNNLYQNFKQTEEFKIFFNYCFPTSRVFSTFIIDEIIKNSVNNPETNTLLLSTDIVLKNIFLTFVNTTNDAKSPLCTSPSNIDLDLDFNLNLEKLKVKFSLQIAIEIFKIIVEKTDPNISIAKPISNAYNSTVGAVSGKTLPVLPFSLALLPFGTIPFGLGPPLIPTLGYPYLALDTYLYYKSLSDSKTKSKIQAAESYNNDFDLDKFEEEC